MKTIYDTGDTFEVDGYHFIVQSSNGSIYPYLVWCKESQEKIGSRISNEDAVNLCIMNINRSKIMNDIFSKDIKYVRNLFESALLGIKKSQCNDAVEKYVCGKIDGRIIAVSVDPQEEYVEYHTPYFIVKALFENGIRRSVTKIAIENREANDDAI